MPATSDRFLRTVAATIVTALLVSPLSATAKRELPIPTGWTKTTVDMHGLKMLVIRSSQETGDVYPVITLHADPWPLTKSVVVAQTDLHRRHVAVGAPRPVECSNHRAARMLTWTYKSVSMRQLFIDAGKSTAVAAYSRAANTAENPQAVNTLYSMCVYPVQAI